MFWIYVELYLTGHYSKILLKFHNPISCKNTQPHIVMFELLLLINSWTFFSLKHLHNFEIRFFLSGLPFCFLFQISIRHGPLDQWGSSGGIARKYFSVFSSISTLQGIGGKFVHHEATGKVKFLLSKLTSGWNY